MKILHQQFAKITTGEFKGKIFQLNHYHQHLHVAYFPGPPEQLISIENLKLVPMPFPYWRTKGEGMMVWTDQPNSKRCDTLPIPEQISLSASRVLKLKTHIKLHKEKLKKTRKNFGGVEEVDDQLYRFLERERVMECKLKGLLGSIIPITQPNKNTILKLEQEFITKNRPKMPGGNIAPPREEILQTTNTQEKPIFPPATKLKKKPGRPRGAKNTIPASGWIDIRKAKDGSDTIYYCHHTCKWLVDKIEISPGKLPEIQSLIEQNYSISQIKEYLLGSKVNAIR
ncbi:MAG: hypothetical protein F6K48_18565 [Okeania sp. SIO3H1]|uniref:hypothetical protein n=1 Tax=Okeania sp. SIO1I7 TaxID=2607772 RepID=UPI0013C744AB|nr:hypothetical protein [Okeania sp. SIO1I7]NEN90806.1 hypothetical protein [Okeania sp. SIO3H1]NET28856.1 hypothetical protein [Okeania sp. SIO1I7]